ncbi:hypothetical protein [Paenibacillus sp. IHBB 10380]|uniref:hypothetical protein n=1 Tax=Paenibacillus sp. IHBB 10380 TaxID=1566358 RepID=UPI000AD77EFE|nr:hypothetical protein [Paenibacillus sp. IHBB 10380]
MKIHNSFYLYSVDEIDRMRDINDEIKMLGFSNFGYGAPTLFSGGIGYFYISPIGEGMPSKNGAKLTDQDKWIGAKLPVEVQTLL